MADKDRERWYLEKLKSCFPCFPTGSIIPGESPDFLVRSEEEVTGIEVTQFYPSPEEGARPGQEVQSLKERIVEVAHRMYVESGGPALYVTVFFRSPLNVTKRDIQSVARNLAEAIRETSVPASINAPPASVAWRDLPSSITKVHIHGSLDGEDQLWHADAGGWVVPVDASHVSAVVARKERMAQIARQKCDRLWLLIINDVFSRATPAELKHEAMRSVGKGVFDRVIWLAPHSGAVFEAP
jgi:hypothetical protein